MEEIWKDIKGFEGRYQISNMGRVKKLSVLYYRKYKKGPVLVHKHPESIVVPEIKAKSRVRLVNTKTGIDRIFDICYLVAFHFIDDYREGMEIRYKDGNIMNNTVDNLILSFPMTIPNEQWKDIKGFEGRYQVSNMGRVRSIDRLLNNGYGVYVRKGQMLSLSENKGKGYLRVSLYRNHRDIKHYEVHRLVALHFVPGYKKGLVVNHKNEIKTDNRADNLEWCTYQYNLNYSDHVAWKRKPLYQYDIDGNFIKKHKCGHQAEIELGFTIVHAVYASKRGYTHGFLFSLEPRTKEYWKAHSVKGSARRRAVIQYTDNMIFINRFNSIKEASIATGIKQMAIIRCCQRKCTETKTGFIWRYEE